jgi:tetratricopeptide (TPR) repeat protein
LILIIGAVLLLLTLAVFFQVRTFGYVNYDDGDYVMSNRHVQEGLTGEQIKWAFTTGHAANWHPLTWMSHMLDFQLFGKNPGLHHLTSLGLHLLNVVSLLVLLYQMTGNVWRSAFVTAMFALHPVHVESVAWLSERKDVLSGLFWFLTMLAYVRYVRSKSNSGLWYGFALAAFALGLMAKPMLVTLPCVLLLIDLWPLQRLPLDAEGRPRLISRRTGLLILEKLPFLGLAMASSVATFLVQRKGGAVATMESFSLGSRMLNCFVSYVRYAGKIFWPTDLAVLYPLPPAWPIWLVILGISFTLVILALSISWWRSKPYFTVGMLWFFGTLVPVIGLVQVGIQSMADRYTYIPSIGFTLAVMWLLCDLVGRVVSGRWIMASLGVLAVVGCLPLTYRQTQYWADSEALFRRTVTVTDRNYLAWNNLGFSLPKSKSEEAIECYRKSIEINPVYTDALNNLGHALAEKGKFQEALPFYQRALQQEPKHADVNNNFGNALSELGQPDQAIHFYQIALATNPDHADAHNNLGIALAMQGKLDEAMPHLLRAIALDPGKASAHSNLGNAYAVQHKLSEAMAQYQEALRLKADEPQVHNNLANVLSELGRFEEALEHYRLALQYNAQNPEAHYNLALALLKLGRLPDAVTHLQQALQLRPNYAEARRQLDALAK